MCMQSFRNGQIYSVTVLKKQPFQFLDDVLATHLKIVKNGLIPHSCIYLMQNYKLVKQLHKDLFLHGSCHFQSSALTIVVHSSS